MTIRDRGKLKWQTAAFLPEHGKMLKEMWKENEQIQKPILDEYALNKIEDQICFAMEFSYLIHIKIWNEGVYWCFKGRVNRLDDINKMIYLQTEEEYIQKISFNEIVEVHVVQ
ncbi:YolD-like family protein [Neobacillus sp. YIM B06451]|uniref:YolD-like family protein n=1 Tax=Neobacillus sp. YIM B06451 TaxID=3070994 RepID=UPI00292CB1D8|nr:YolD-like family protein [Neobacillus sp. YIM B06451]